MLNLIKANITRLFKNKLFWLCMAFMLFFGGFILACSRAPEGTPAGQLVGLTESIIFSGSTVASVLASVVTAFFVGTEYSDGTIRNKIIVGHSRPRVYLANLVVCTVAALTLHLIYILLIVTVGQAALVHFTASPVLLLKLILISFVSMLASESLFLMFAMLIHSKPFTVAALILVSVSLIAYQEIVFSRLNEPEYYEAYSWVDESGIEHEEPREKNPSYPTGAKRKYYEFMYDTLPGCQVYQLSDMAEQAAYPENKDETKDEELLKFAAYSLIIITVSSAAGLTAFKFKNLK
ncbi:MAG: ABC transporter permease subunit [Acutalibacteraceae bacterium]